MNLFYFAGHESQKIKDGAGTRSFYIFESLKDYFCHWVYVKKEAVFYKEFKLNYSFLRPWSNFKFLAAFKTLINKRNYMENKHIGLIHFLFSLLFFSRINFNFVYLHFIWSFFLVKPFIKGKRLIIDTHNFELSYWDNFKCHSNSAIEKKICEYSSKRTESIVSQLPKNTIFLHVSKEDSVKYERYRPDLTHIVLPNGCTINPRNAFPSYLNSRKSIYFLGSLGLYATKKSLSYFSDCFWPLLCDFCDFYLIGSGNKQMWDKTCRKNGWELLVNVSDKVLDDITSRMHYCVLPFNFASGSKLKFIDACARGIPVISTPPGVCGFSNLPPTVRISENPSDWASWISSPEGPTEAEISACLGFAKEYSWDNLVARVWPQIVNHPPVP